MIEKDFWLWHRQVNMEGNGLTLELLLPGLGVFTQSFIAMNVHLIYPSLVVKSREFGYFVKFNQMCWDHL